MAERFKKIWHDPVWSKVISGLILALLVLLRDLWSKSGYSINMKVAWSAAIDALASAPGAVRAWLTEPVYMPRGSALVLVVIVVLLEVWLIIRLGRRAANQIQQFRRAGIALNAELEKVKLAKTELAAQLEQARLAGADSAVELAKAQGEITELKRLVTAAQLAKPRIIDPPEASLDKIAMQALRVLYRVYPKGRSVDEISAAIGETYPVTERALETLSSLEFARFFAGSYTANSAWLLAKKGRDYCIRKATVK